MGKRGPRNTPIELLKLRGTVEKSRHAKRMVEPKPPGNLADPPDFLSPLAAESWRYCIRHAPSNILRMIDRNVLVTFCEAEARWRTANEQQQRLDRDNPLPLLLKSKRTGDPVISPYVRAMTLAADLMLRAAAELGFSPAARTRLGTPLPQQPVDPDPNGPWARLRVLQGGKDRPD